MNSKKNYIFVCYSSFILLGISLFFFFLFLLLNWKWIFFWPALVFLLLSAALYFIAIKQLKLIEGYNLLQAISFYFQCKKNGYDGKLTKESAEILRETAKNENFPVSDADEKFLVHAYNTGKKTVDCITNPLIIFIWKLQGYK